MSNKNGTLILTFPLQLADGELAELTFNRRMTIGDQLEQDRKGGSALEQEIRLFAKLTGRKVEELQRLDQYDYECLQAEYKNFMRPPQPREEEPTA
jgi:hypothetical protein